MCCNGDGSHYDDDKWCAMSGALKIRNEIWMIYTKTYEAKRIISLMGGRWGYFLKAKAAKKWSISVKQKLLEEKKLWMHADDKLHNQRCRDSSKLQTNWKLVMVTKQPAEMEKSLF